MVWIINYFVSSHSLKGVLGVNRNGRVEYKVACMNGCHLLVAILDCGAEMLSLFRTRQGQIGWGLLVFTCYSRTKRYLSLYSTK